MNKKTKIKELMKDQENEFLSEMWEIKELMKDLVKIRDQENKILSEMWEILNKHKVYK